MSHNIKINDPIISDQGIFNESALVRFIRKDFELAHKINELLERSARLDQQLAELDRLING